MILWDNLDTELTTMPIEISWDSSNRPILFMRVSGDWKLDDYYENYLRSKKMMESVDHPVFLVLDMTENKTIPTRMMSTASFSKKNRARNLEFTVFVGASLLISKLAEVMTTITSRDKRRLYFADTIDDAYQLVDTFIKEKSF